MRDVGPDLTVEQVAAILSLHRTTVKAKILAGEIDAWAIDPNAKRKHFRIPPQAVERFRQPHAVYVDHGQQRQHRRPASTKKKWY